MEFKNLKQETKPNGIRILTVSRKAALNALNVETLREFVVILKNIKEDESVRVLILTGEGDKAFIAGADILEMKAMAPADAVTFGRLGQEVSSLLEKFPVPVIAAVNGYALGGGTELAISCDFIYCSENAVFGLPEVTLGVIPGFGGTMRFSRFVGAARAKEFIFSGKKISSKEALEMGLVNSVFPKEELLNKAIETAEAISRNSLVAVKQAKKLIIEFSESFGHERKLDAEALAFGGLFNHIDQVEGMAAFSEKRKPKFQGM